MLCNAYWSIKSCQPTTWRTEEGWAGHLIVPWEVVCCTVPSVHGGGGRQEDCRSSLCLPQDKASQVQLLSGNVGQFFSCTVSSETSRSLLELCSDFQNNFCPPPCPKNDWHYSVCICSCSSFHLCLLKVLFRSKGLFSWLVCNELLLTSLKKQRCISSLFWFCWHDAFSVEMVTN